MADFYPAYLKEKKKGNILLSDKALKILRLQAEGLSVETIAKQLGLSKAGVKYYNQETYKRHLGGGCCVLPPYHLIRPSRCLEI